MTQEDKELLLKDLCGRLSYGELKIYMPEISYIGNITGTAKVGSNILFQIDHSQTSWSDVSEIKPYLRPLSSMTEEEKEIYERFKKLLVCKVVTFDKGLYDVSYCVDIDEDSHDVFDWLNTHHFDYRGLIEKGLALEAPEGMYKKIL